MQWNHRFPALAERRPARLAVGAALVIGAALVVAGAARQRGGSQDKADVDGSGANIRERFPVTIRKPAGPPTVKTGQVDMHGKPVEIACGTCHATRPTNAQARLGVDLPSFHQGLKGKHGNLACAACHNPADGYQTLRLADGKAVPYSEVMQLCAQCHGPQYRDYLRGAHGGMMGHWDLSRGPRTRNNCIDCHDPHAPRYPTVRPAQGPNDRFLRGGSQP